MKPVVVEFERLEDFVRIAKHQEGLVFVSSGSLYDTLWVLPNKAYPLVFEHICEASAWKHLERDLNPIPGKIEQEGE